MIDVSAAGDHGSGPNRSGGRIDFWTTPSGTNNIAHRMTISDSGNVGIGTPAPASILHTVASGAKTAAYTGNYLSNTATTATAGINKIGLDIESTGAWTTTGVNTGLVVNATGGTTNYAATFSGGNVGIGTTAPVSPLTVSYSATSGSGIELSNSSSTWQSNVNVTNNVGKSGGMGIFGSAFGTPGLVNEFSVGSNASGLIMMTDGDVASGGTDPIRFLVGGWDPTLVEKMRITSAGNVGIGTTAPSVALEVVGQVKITGGTPGAGEVLTSDAAGLATWAVPSAGSVSALTAAAGTQTLANANFAQAWNWDTLSTQSALSLGSTSITSGKLINATSTSTAMTGVLSNFALTGNNAANTGTVLKSTVTGASSAAVGLMVTNGGTGMSVRVNDDGTDTDSTPFVIDAAGNVGIGTTAPGATLDIKGQVGSNPVLRIQNNDDTGVQL
jgi:hypothetical protein